MKMRIITAAALSVALVFSCGSAFAYDTSFDGVSNGEFYTSADYDTAPSWEETPAGEDTRADASLFAGDYIAPSSGAPVYPDVWANDKTVTYNDFTLPEAVMEADGSIGLLTIAKICLSAKVYEGEDLVTMTKGVGHFRSTSSWDGNIGLCGHNRTGFFGRLKELKTGDLITYKTKLGERTYQVTFTGQIADTDFSRLSRQSVNTLTMITCVESVPSKRLCIVATEV